MSDSRDTERRTPWARSILIAFGVASVVVAVSQASHPQDVFAAPTATVSRYEETVNSSTLWNQGCNAGTTTGDVIIDFAQPWYQNGTYGTWNWSNQFFSIAQITSAAEQWLMGFGACSQAGALANVRLVVGTSNDFGYTGSGHGSAWASMVNAINAWIATPPSWISFENARGGIDAETGWSNVSTTEAWATGYDNSFNCSNSCSYYYNYGDSAGCPPYGGCNGNWTQQAVWWMSWGATAAYPFPEIYWYAPGYGAAVNATQWQAINAKYPMTFLGVLTQKAACGCANTNSAAQGWQELNSASGQSPYYSSDITWAN